MKTVNYRGMNFEIEDHFKYIATDEDVLITVFEFPPLKDDDQWLVVRGKWKMLTGNIKGWENSLENC